MFATLAIALAVAACAGGEIAPADPTSGTAFDATLVAQGAQLAAVGDCASCHTVQSGPSYAGGVPLKTPFGTIYGSNITPDPDTGIGRWSEAAFVRAMREGIARDGHHLYPAFPYNHFRLASSDDLHAIYAFMMTRDPVSAQPPANDLRFPFNVRALISVWNTLYLERDAVHSDTAQSSEWNRGAYLVDGLGHCGACHTPRNGLGAEQSDQYLAGAETEGWYAPALNHDTPSPQPWTPEALNGYLSRGFTQMHAIAGGPMQQVVESLKQASQPDVNAMATYIAATMTPVTAQRDARAQTSRKLAQDSTARALTVSSPVAANDLGASIYQGACAQCHDQGRGLSSADALQLPLAVAVHDPNPASLIRIIREGIKAPEGERQRWMPAFAGAFNDEQMTALVAYLRTFAPDAAPWPNVADAVKQARSP